MTIVLANTCYSYFSYVLRVKTEITRLSHKIALNVKDMVARWRGVAATCHPINKASYCAGYTGFECQNAFRSGWQC